MVGAGVTLEEAMKAHDTLAKEGINIRVIDPFTLKPIDKELLIASAKATGGRVVTVEDHYDQGKEGKGCHDKITTPCTYIHRCLFLLPFFLSPPPLFPPSFSPFFVIGWVFFFLFFFLFFLFFLPLFLPFSCSVIRWTW